MFWSAFAATLLATLSLMYLLPAYHYWQKDDRLWTDWAKPGVAFWIACDMYTMFTLWNPLPAGSMLVGPIMGTTLMLAAVTTLALVGVYHVGSVMIGAFETLGREFVSEPE